MSNPLSSREKKTRNSLGISQGCCHVISIASSAVSASAKITLSSQGGHILMTDGHGDIKALPSCPNVESSKGFPKSIPLETTEVSLGLHCS